MEKIQQMPQGLKLTELHSFDEVMHRVQTKADKYNPDYVGQVNRVKVIDYNTFEFPDLPHPGPFKMTLWSRDQLALWLGVKWDKYFDREFTLLPDMEEDINRHLRGRDKSFRIRTTRDGSNGTVAGTLRAWLSPSYHPIDDAYIFGKLREQSTQIRGFLTNISKSTDKASYFMAVMDEDLNISGDKYYGGYLLKNSEVGYSSLSFFSYLWRLICTNGLVSAIKHVLFSRRHTRIKDEKAFGTIMHKALAGYLTNQNNILDQLQKLSDKTYATAEEARDMLLGYLIRSEVPSGTREAIVASFDEEPGFTAYEQFNAITASARSLSPDKRFDAEQLAGRLLDAPTAIWN